ncbi:MAG TPA: class I SAM-dependent methyltransferase, partial [Chloroflexota bacterium]|nr:class I SAM-dependent methyltransferase [Chloroflexota bacterium]
MSKFDKRNVISQALCLFDDQPLGIRAFVRTRNMLCPMRNVEAAVPQQGRILELGCGHGLFSAVMAMSAPERSILGVDPSSVKIDVASRMGQRLPNAEFFQGTIDDVHEDGLAGIAIIDVLYLLPVEEKLRILRRCHELLAPNGRLVLKTNDTHPVWKYRWAWFEEWLGYAIAVDRECRRLRHQRRGESG